jgi:hypothetical protein
MPDLNGVLRSITVAAVLGMLAGCSHKSSPPTASTAAGPPAAAAASADNPDEQDPCALLDPKDVEAALGAPLAVPPYRSSNATVGASSDGNACVYETSKFRYMTLEVTYEGGAQAYSMGNMVKGLMKSGGGDDEHAANVKKNFRLDDGTEMTGEWDEASLTAMNCCIFSALRGDQLIQIDFTATPMTLKQAATLVDSAYKRIDKPLQIDGSAAVSAAKQLNQTRPKPVDVCSILTADEVAAILGPGATPQSHGQNGCTYAMPVPAGALPQVYELNLRWQGGYYQWRSDRYVNHIGTNVVAQTAADYIGKSGPAPESHDQADPAAADLNADPAELVSDNGLNYVTVRKDVQVAVNARMVDRARAQALVAAVAGKM